ncbi:MAG: hypothetical protein WCB05_11815 [Candidatus Sulfotelmatobacter sp.]
MQSRLLGVIAFAGILGAGVSSAQEGIAEVPLPQNIYGAIVGCGTEGQAYLSSIGYEYFVLRVSLDGSSQIFNLPDKRYARVVAPYADGVNILSPRLQPEKKRIIYHFDNLGNLLARHFVSTDLDDTIMATTSSGTTILVGRHRASENEDWEYGGIVLDASDRVVSHFKLPSPPAGGGWSFGPLDHLDEPLMTADDRAAYVVLHSDEPLVTEIATISESGELSVKTLPEPILDDPHDHIKWLVGPGVAVEMYSFHMVKAGHLVGGPVDHFDEYDLRSGKKIASKTARMGSAHPFTAACYYGESVAGLGSSLDTPDGSYLRLRIATLH